MLFGNAETSQGISLDCDNVWNASVSVKSNTFLKTTLVAKLKNLLMYRDF